MYAEIVSALEDADTNPNVLICCLTGKGSYFSSGNDLANYVNLNVTEKFEQSIDNAVTLFK
jgi:enoyl-CoA hydratase/carnithine racemase